LRAIIEFCVNNLDLGSREAKEKFEQNPEYDIVEYGCLGNCGECFMFPYALVNGEMVGGENSADLIEKIEGKIAEWEAESTTE
jgi:uncharacterized protein YuzB (UPF0349 family)